MADDRFAHAANDPVIRKRVEHIELNMLACMYLCLIKVEAVSSCVHPPPQRFSSARSKSKKKRTSAVLKDERFDRMYKDPNFMDGRPRALAGMHSLKL